MRRGASYLQGEPAIQTTDSCFGQSYTSLMLDKLGWQKAVRLWDPVNSNGLAEAGQYEAAKRQSRRFHEQ